MELKRLIAEDSKSALQSVRTTYGEDALIVSTNKIGSKTEVICAVDLLPDNEPFVEATKTEKPMVAVQASTTEAAPFSASLDSVLDNKANGSDAGLANLVANIQQELLELRQSVVAHVEANPHELNTQPESETGASLCERAIRQQYGSLRTLPLNEQRAWEGSHLFLGRPGAGKTTCIQNLLAAHDELPPENSPSFALIAFSSSKNNRDEANEHWLELAKISQKFGVPCVHAKSYSHLDDLIAKLSASYSILMDSQAELVGELQELESLITKHNIQTHCCVGADFAPQTASDAANLTQSTIITRADLAGDLKPMFGALGQAQTHITAVTAKVAPTLGLD